MFQRQSFLKPIETPALDRTLKGCCVWFLWKIASITYLLCAALPIALYVTCLLLVAIERRSTIELPIFMSVMLHPIATIPVGIFANMIHQNLSRKIFKNQNEGISIKILRRLSTYSINVHFALIAVTLNYLYGVWLAIETTSSLNFENRPYEKCECDALRKNNLTCNNHETEDSFQNMFIGVAIQPFLIAYLIISLSCHLVQSLILYLPPQTQLIHYILGPKQIEENDSDPTLDKKRTKLNSWPFKLLIVCFIFCAFIGILIGPHSLFESHEGNGNNYKNSLFRFTWTYISTKI